MNIATLCAAMRVRIYVEGRGRGSRGVGYGGRRAGQERRVRSKREMAEDIGHYGADRVEISNYRAPATR